ncbi:HEPN domain-containing protein [Desulfolucanica intricata]|uniref:HEPN domain-containing protein n=1 Tax=Desulfolucanica intricata TaxID=1285191 RepID=UPI00082FB3A0|nr:HEPN domain-containing protein [Desulfolucanica intricata]
MIYEVLGSLILKSLRINKEYYLECGFFCHLAIEKMFKALILHNTKVVPPKSHNLIFLAKKSGILIKLDESMKDLIADLQPFNIEGRYPEDRRRILENTPKRVFHEILNKTQEGAKWLEKNLKL